MKWTEIITILIGTGTISTITQLLITSNLNKRFFRFSNLYKDKVDIIKELYKLLIKAEGGLKILMIESQPNIVNGNDGIPDKKSTKKLVEFKSKTYDTIDSFFDFYDQNEIVFEEEIVNIIKMLREKFNNAISAQSRAERREQNRGSKLCEKAALEKGEAYALFVVKEIPELRNELKTFFQKQYKILKAN